MLEPFLIPARILWNLRVREQIEQLVISLAIVLSKRAKVTLC